MQSISEYAVKKIQTPMEKNLDKDVEWVCSSLGFVSSRDHDKTAMRIIKALVYAAKDGKGLTSEELTELVKPTRGSVLYHLKRLMRAGLVVKIDSCYELTQKSLTKTIEDAQTNINNVLQEIKRISMEVDEELGMPYR
ncbi:helix-turn-helix transcriptional regulator [Candidatus Woesearchaeota archaeon]|nr:helix-turn-helix transcriptional regulator [Candidatus Woesearchaeota archaeon]